MLDLNLLSADDEDFDSNDCQPFDASLNEALKHTPNTLEELEQQIKEDEFESSIKEDELKEHLENIYSNIDMSYDMIFGENSDD